jgi:hypothetical protein
LGFLIPKLEARASRIKAQSGFKLKEPATASSSVPTYDASHAEFPFNAPKAYLCHDEDCLERLSLKFEDRSP